VYVNKVHSDFWLTHKTLWPAEEEICDTSLRTKASSVTINQCLSFSCIASPCTTAERMELQWTRDFSDAAAISKETTFMSLLNIICLKFLDHKSLLQLFLNCDNFCLFPYPSTVGKRDKILLVTLIGFRTFLHCVCSVTAEKDRQMGFTKIESYNPLNSVFSGYITQEWITCDLPKHNRGLKPKCK
jgi:hypothetical protein